MRRWLTSLRTLARPADRGDAPADGAWRIAVKGRVLLAAGALALWTVVIFGRLVQLQVFQHPEMRARADQQHRDNRVLPAGRGDILDRHGRLLAYSVDGASLEGYPNMVTDAAQAARKVCETLGDCSAADVAAMTRQLSHPDTSWVRIRPASLVKPHQIPALQQLKLSPVGLIPETLRYYPHRELAAHVLGFVGSAHHGLSGIESRFDSAIRGQDGRLLVQKDAHSREMFTRVEQAPTAGATVELTIDATYQHIAERELLAGIRESGAQAGSAVVMNPHSGEILALANYPTFNPNAHTASPADHWRNRAVQEVYEPGSTFKIVTAAAAIEEGVLSPSDLVDCSPGFLRLPGRTVREVKGHNYGVLTFEDVIVKSSNVGSIKAGLQVGAERMARFARRLGFGQTLAPDFSGESPGVVHPLARLNDNDLASMSMGYSVSVTPVQMAAAVSAVANGGLLYQPHVVRATITDGVRTPVAPRLLRRAIRPQTANALTTIMEAVVERGTAKAAALAHYRVAGKTGTAEKIVDGRYSDTDHNASFVGFVPSRRPAFTILVVIDTPRTGRYGGGVAGPVFKRIAEALLQQAGVPPSIDPAPTVIVTEDVARPRPQVIRTAAPAVLQPAGGPALMPDVRGLGAREALRVLVAAGLYVESAGSGLVVAQTPAAGVPIDAGDRTTLELARVPRPPILTPPPGGGR
jgi:cell division protein FtsI (penicillin-binding protein 3)